MGRKKIEFGGDLSIEQTYDLSLLLTQEFVNVKINSVNLNEDSQFECLDIKKVSSLIISKNCNLPMERDFEQIVKLFNAAFHIPTVHDKCTEYKVHEVYSFYKFYNNYQKNS